MTNCQKGKVYELDEGFGPSTSTQTVFESAIEPLVWNALEGGSGIPLHNSRIATVLGYGQTGTGKSYTLFGSKSSAGVVSLALNAIFAFIEATPDKEFLVRLSYFEMNAETINDLITPDRTNLPLVDTPPVEMRMRSVGRSAGEGRHGGGVHERGDGYGDFEQWREGEICRSEQ